MSDLFADLTPTPAAYLKAARRVDEITGLRALRVAVLSTFTAEFLAPYLRVEGARRGLNITPWFAPWGQLEEQALDPTSALYAEQPDAIVVLARLEDQPAFSTRLGALLDALRRHSAARLLIANFAPPARLAAGLADASLPLSEMAATQQANDALTTACRAVPDAFVFDFARLVVEHGLAAWVDAKLFHLARLPFGVRAQIALGRRLARTLRAAFIPPAKVLVLDLDHTLWGGVLGEDGVGGIALGDEYPGNVFKDFQRYLVALKGRGVLLAIASKNNAADVDEVFTRHRDLVLRREDFAAVRINWEPKSDNLRALAAELNLGLDSFVFLDDSPFEREEVRQALPMVQVLDFPSSPLGLIAAVEDSGWFDRLTLSAEDGARTELYRAQSVRQAAEQTADSREEFLASLGLVATIGAVDAETLPRVAQLLAKTNQFNLTTRRHNAADVQAMLDAGAVALWLRLADRFGDHGLVGVALALPGEMWRIDSFLLSCRVIGRGVETALLARVCELVRARGGKELIGEYMPTAKNALVAEFYPQHGFTSAGEGTWRLALAEGVKTPPHITLQTA
jgi:FkbH-like protein